MNRDFKEAFVYLKSSRLFIYGIIWIFLISTVAGFFLHDYLTSLDALIKDLLSKTEGLGTLDLIVFIFLNNTQSALFGLLFGFAAGIFPIFHSILNGAVLGYVLHLVFETSGFIDFWRILPHGIFELPAIFISLGLGLRLCTFVFSSKPWASFKIQLYYSLIVFLALVLPLLIIAALIEGSLIGLYG